MRHLAILGSTGSIGRQALDVVARNPNLFRVRVLAAHHSDELLEKQIQAFAPDIAVLTDEEAAERLRGRYKGSTKIWGGSDALVRAAAYEAADTVLTSLVGFAGLRPTLAAIEAGKTIALANKETLVAAGQLVTQLAKKKGVSILPVDSEHSAILQCLQQNRHQDLQKILLTASGGPFRGWMREQMAHVSREQVLKHPNWSMGAKITVDSATLINKALEVIEAKWLFNVSYDQIQVIVHPQSVIHSMVEYIDGSVIAQMGCPDMRLPIQYALSYPERLPAEFPRLDFTRLSALTFYPPDLENFPGLALGFQAGRAGGTMPCVLSAANEIAVYAFLRGDIGFLSITEIVQQAMEAHHWIAEPSFEELIQADQWARDFAQKRMGNRIPR